MSKYSFARCLENSYKVNWTIDGVLEDRRFDRSCRWLPGYMNSDLAPNCVSHSGRRAPLPLDLLPGSEVGRQNPLTPVRNT